MVAMAATIAVVYPHMNHLGGDGFWLVREPSGKVRALMAAGAAGARATPALYRDAGHDTIPTRGPLAALTVPGAVAGWMLALDAARLTAAACRSPICSPLPPSTRTMASRSPPLRAQHRGRTRELARVPDFAETFLVDGKPPRRERGCALRRSPPRSSSSRMPGSMISIAATSGARSRPISIASAAR